MEEQTEFTLIGTLIMLLVSWLSLSLLPSWIAQFLGGIAIAFFPVAMYVSYNLGRRAGPADPDPGHRGAASGIVGANTVLDLFPDETLGEPDETPREPYVTHRRTDNNETLQVG